MPDFFEQIKSDWISHGRDWTRPGFRALAIYRFGVWRMTIRSHLWRAALSLVYRILYRRARDVYGIEIPYTAKIGQKVVFEHQHGIVIHGASVIGDGCIIRQGVTLGIRSLDRLDEAPILGSRVNVGAGAKLLGKIHIGDNVNIGANSVVLVDVEKNATVAGVPARVLRTRS